MTEPPAEAPTGSTNWGGEDAEENQGTAEVPADDQDHQDEQDEQVNAAVSAEDQDSSPPDPSEYLSSASSSSDLVKGKGKAAVETEGAAGNLKSKGKAKAFDNHYAAKLEVEGEWKGHGHIPEEEWQPYTHLLAKQPSDYHPRLEVGESSKAGQMSTAGAPSLLDPKEFLLPLFKSKPEEVASPKVAKTQGMVSSKKVILPKAFKGPSKAFKVALKSSKVLSSKLTEQKGKSAKAKGEEKVVDPDQPAAK